MSTSWKLDPPDPQNAMERARTIAELPVSHPVVAVRDIRAWWDDEDEDALDSADSFVQPICTCGWDGAITQSYEAARRQSFDHLIEHLA